MQTTPPFPGACLRSNWASWFIFANGLLCLLVGLRFLPWMTVPDIRLLTPGAESWDRDIQITDDWLAFTSTERQTDDPFFGFLFYDTTHNHAVPDDSPVKFQPYWETVNKLALDQDFNPELIKNNYKSTLHFVDNQIGRVLDDLRARKLLSSTVVMITGDHGQEFNEYGMNCPDSTSSGSEASHTHFDVGQFP